MNDLETLLERTKIGFKRNLKFKEIKDLFRYIQKNLQCEVEYQFLSNGRIGSMYNNEKSIKQYVSKASGSIRSRENTIGVSFDLERSLEYGFSCLKFFTTPGYDLNEIPSRDLKLMDEIKLQVENYFREGN